MPKKEATQSQAEPGQLYTPGEFGVQGPQKEHPPEAVAAWKAIDVAIEKTQQALRDMLELDSKRSAAVTQAMYAGTSDRRHRCRSGGRRERGFVLQLQHEG